jgi:hypothetical protein
MKTQYFNFFVENDIWTHAVLPMGWCASPRFARMAMDMTFTDDVLKQFLEQANISPLDFPFKSYANFYQSFVDDISIFSWKERPKDYVGTFSREDMHMVCVQSVFWTLEKHGWLISLRKSTIVKSRFIFLGLEWNMDEESSEINSDRVKAMLDWRDPRSIAELSSRLSSIAYFESHVFFLKRISLPLFEMVKTGICKWEQVHCHAWQDLLCLVSIVIKNHILILIIHLSA